MTTQETALVRVPSYDDKQRELIKHTVAKGTTAEEFELFIQVCLATGLNPFARQIYAVMRSDHGVNKMTIQTGIDGYRLLAQRTGKYRGQTPVEWCGKDGKWVDVWLKDEPPAAARVGVYYADFPHPTYAVARYKSYAATYTNGAPMPMWAKMPEVMLAKCAEALALRKVFPGELSGIYTKEEMEQAGEPLVTPIVTEVAHDEQTPTVEGKIIEDTPMPTYMASEKQLASISKLCEHLNKPAPHEALSYDQASPLLDQLTLEYRQMREAQKASEKPATPQSTNHSTDSGKAMPAPQPQENEVKKSGLLSENIAHLIERAKKRAKAVGSASTIDEWYSFIGKCLGEEGLHDADLDLGRIAKINGRLTQLEREQQLVAK